MPSMPRWPNASTDLHPISWCWPGSCASWAIPSHRRALDEGVRVHGCTVHFVTPALDHGPVIIQAAVPVLDSDDEATLAARVLGQEHRVYPQAVRWFAEGRLRVENGRVRLAAECAGDAVLVSPAER